MKNNTIIAALSILAITGWASAQFSVKTRPVKKYASMVHGTFEYSEGQTARDAVAENQKYKDLLDSICPTDFKCTMHINLVPTLK